MINPFDEEVRSLEISPTPSYSDTEEEINNAYEESIKEKSILPILKQELRLKIQTRRLSEGQEELYTEKTEPNKVYEVCVFSSIIIISLLIRFMCCFQWN
jgi:hypothetical protein